jgi:hypothetical protein
MGVVWETKGVVMRKQFFFSLVASFLLIMNQGQATTLHEYDISNDKTVNFGGSKVKSVKLGDKTKRDGLSFYSGNVELELEYHPEGKPAFTKKVNVWFDRRSDALLFEAVMNNDPNLDLYYNFSRNPFNWTAYQSSCRILGSFICRDTPVTAVDFNNIDGNKLFIHNRDTDRMTKATNASHAHEVAELEHNVQDGARDESRRSPAGDVGGQVSESSQAISV